MYNITLRNHIKKKQKLGTTNVGRNSGNYKMTNLIQFYVFCL